MAGGIRNSLMDRETGLDIGMRMVPSTTSPENCGVKSFDRAHEQKVHVHAACDILHSSPRKPSLLAKTCRA